MGYDFFDKIKEPQPAAYTLVGGAFTCRFCYEITDDARYYPDQRILSWDCEGCKRANNVEGFSLD